MSASTSYLHATQKAFRTVVSTATWRYPIGNRTSVPIYFISPPRRISTRRISTHSSKVRVTTNASVVPLVSLVTLGAAISLGTVLYRKSSVDKVEDESVVPQEQLPKDFTYFVPRGERRKSRTRAEEFTKLVKTSCRIHRNSPENGRNSQVRWRSRHQLNETIPCS